MIRWITALSIIYVSILGLLMLIGTQEVSAIFFWLNIFVIGLVTAYGILLKMKDTYHSIFWKLQRISAAFLVVMVPAHFIFMHLNPSVSKEATIVISRMNSLFIKGVDVCLVVAALYHGAYGLISVLKDYLDSGIVRVGLASIIALAMLIFAWVGIKLTLTI
jgi:succinate dehydrogenase hydrophobic membrane anchor protein